MKNEVSSSDFDLKYIKELLIKISEKLDKIIEGPVFNSTLTRIGTLDEIAAKNMRSLNDMILQVKGIVSQVHTLRGRKNDWDGEEINCVNIPKGKRLEIEKKE